MSASVTTSCAQRRSAVRSGEVAQWRRQVHRIAGLVFLRMDGLVAAVVVTLMVLTVSGCALAPAQEMTDARLALEAAREEGAGLHSAEWLVDAQQLLDEAEQAIGQQDFGRARTRATVSRAFALSARSVAAVARSLPGREDLLSSARASMEPLLVRTRNALAQGEAREAEALALEVVSRSQDAVAHALQQGDSLPQ